MRLLSAPRGGAVLRLADGNEAKPPTARRTTPAYPAPPFALASAEPLLASAASSRRRHSTRSPSVARNWPRASLPSPAAFGLGAPGDANVGSRLNTDGS